MLREGRSCCGPRDDRRSEKSRLREAECRRCGGWGQKGDSSVRWTMYLVLRLRDEAVLYHAVRASVHATWVFLVVGSVLLAIEVLVNGLDVEVRDPLPEGEESVYQEDSHDVNQHIRGNVRRLPFCPDELEARSDEKNLGRHDAMREQMDEAVECVSVLVVDSCSLADILDLVLLLASSRVVRDCPVLVRHISLV